MTGLSIGTPFINAASNALSKSSMLIGRLFTDPSFVTISQNSLENPTLIKIAETFNKLTLAAQNSGFRALMTKNVASAYDPKPTGRIAVAALEEGAHILGRFAPQLTRGGVSPAMIGGIICAAGLAFLMTDSTVQQMAMEQINNITALWQNDNAETNAMKAEKQEAMTTSQLTPTATYQRPSHNNFTI